MGVGFELHLGLALHLAGPWRAPGLSLGQAHAVVMISEERSAFSQSWFPGGLWDAPSAPRGDCSWRPEFRPLWVITRLPSIKGVNLCLELCAHWGSRCLGWKAMCPPYEGLKARRSQQEVSPGGLWVPLSFLIGTGRLPRGWAQDQGPVFPVLCWGLLAFLAGALSGGVPFLSPWREALLFEHLKELFVRRFCP